MSRPIPTTRFDLIPPGAERRLAQLYARDAGKYGPRDWERGQISLSTFLNLAREALNLLHAGDTSADHSAVACWALFGFMHTEAMIKAGRLPAALADMPAADPILCTAIPEIPALPDGIPVPPAPPKMLGQ